MKSIAIDGVAFGGLALVTFGCWIIYQPLAYIVPGLFFMASGVSMARVEASKGGK